MAANANDEARVDMKRFWFCVYREDPLFHASQMCQHLQNRPRDLEDFPVAHIPADSNEVGSESELRFCTDCGVANPFE